MLLRYIGDGPVDLISTPDSSLHFTSEPEENDEDDVISDIDDPHSLSNSLGKRFVRVLYGCFFMIQIL